MVLELTLLVLVWLVGLTNGASGGTGAATKASGCAAPRPLQQQVERQRGRSLSPSVGGTPESLTLLGAGFPEPAQSARRHRCRGGVWQDSPADRTGYSVEVTEAETKTISKGCAPMTVDVASRVKDKVFDAKETVQVTADAVKQQVYEGTEALHTTAGRVASQAKGLTQQAVGTLLPPVAARTETLMTTARQRPLPTAAVAIVVLWVLQLVLRRLLRGNE